MHNLTFVIRCESEGGFGKNIKSLKRLIVIEVWALAFSARQHH